MNYVWKSVNRKTCRHWTRGWPTSKTSSTIQRLGYGSIQSKKDSSERWCFSRITALLSSALLYFGYVPEKLTPMIRPLIECTDSEENLKVAEEILYDALPLLLSYTCQRTPCPHSKIIKQLCNGLVSCKTFVPDVNSWWALYGKIWMFRSSPEKELTIISTSQHIEEKGLKSKNCRMAMQAICDHFGLNILGIVPDLKAYLTLEKDDDLEVSWMICATLFSNIYWTSKSYAPSPHAYKTFQLNKKPNACPNISLIRTQLYVSE